MPVSPAVAAEEVIPVQHAVAPTVRPEPKPLAVLQKVQKASAAGVALASSTLCE